MVTVLAGLAEFERSLILGLNRGGANKGDGEGYRVLQEPKLTSHQIAEAKVRRAAGEALAEIGRSYNVSHSAISRL
jgi:hypothetical protein